MDDKEFIEYFKKEWEAITGKLKKHSKELSRIIISPDHSRPRP